LPRSKHVSTTVTIVDDGAIVGARAGFSVVNSEGLPRVELQAHTLLFQLSADTLHPFTASSYVKGPPKYQQPLPPKYSNVGDIATYPLPFKQYSPK